ncbi:MAG: putative signal transducing protein [Gemmatimonadaceae bacterium]
MDVNTEWESLGLFPTGLDADIARQALEEAGIPVLVKGDRAGIFGAAFQGAFSGGVEILVPTIALAHAREILDWPVQE